MAMMEHDRFSLSREEEQTTRSVIAGGSTFAAIAGLAGGVLALLGLLGMRPDLFAAIATICIGAAFLIEGGAIASRVSSLRSGTSIRSSTGMVSGGMTLDTLAGVAGIALGVLALLGYRPLTLLNIAAIVLGCGMLIESGALPRLNNLITSCSRLEDPARRGKHGVVNATAGFDALAGIAAIALGVLGLLGYSPLTMALIAMLTLGSVTLLSGAALSSRAMTAFSH